MSNLQLPVLEFARQVFQSVCILLFCQRFGAEVGLISWILSLNYKEKKKKQINSIKIHSLQKVEDKGSFIVKLPHIMKAHTIIGGIIFE